MRTISTWWLLAAFFSGMALAMLAEGLILNTRENRLEFSTPSHYLSGEPRLLARLHNAAEVPFQMQTTLWSGNRNHIFAQATKRCVVSFDLWEEKYSAVTLTPGKAPKKQSHLTATGAEKWCVDQMSLDITGLSSSEKLWSRLDIRAEDPSRDSALFGPGNIGEAGISLTSLLEVFSRPPRAQQPHWIFDTEQPFTLDQLRRGGRF